MRFLGELLHDGQLLRGLLDLEHTVETRITHHGDILDTDLQKQLFREFVLYEEMREAVQNATILSTIPLEEHLILTEDARHAIHRHIPVLQDMQVVIPELVFDEISLHGSDQSQEADGVDGCVQRQIADDIRTLVVLPHLVA